MPDNETLRTLRELAGYTQSEAAEVFNVHPVTWRMRELGRYPIAPGFVDQVKAAFWPVIRERGNGAFTREKEVAVAS